MKVEIHIPSQGVWSFIQLAEKIQKGFSIADRAVFGKKTDSGFSMPDGSQGGQQRLLQGPRL